jgi:hypothetical protein
MTGNYNIDHKLLDIPLFQQKLTPTEHQALLITISYIVHWCRNATVCHFKQGELSRDWRIKQDFFAKATGLLLKHHYIKMIKPHSQRDQTSAIYGLDRACTPFAQKLYPKKSKAVPQGGRVNNINNIIGEDVNTPPQFKNESTSSDAGVYSTVSWKQLKKQTK